MSRGNIISIKPGVTIVEDAPVSDGSLVVTFDSHGSPKSYKYYGADAEAILAGSDPADFDAERTF